MKTKIGTVIEEDIFKKLKEYSSRENRSISEVIESALANYLKGEQKNSDLRTKAVERFCSNPFKLSDDDWTEIMELDVYEQ